MTVLEGVVQKSDLNGYGLMHGGRLLTLCDEVGYLAAKKHCDCDFLTKAAHDVLFNAFMHEGDAYRVEAKVVLTGSTTLWTRCRIMRDEETVMSALFVYIAVDSGFQSISVPEVIAEDDSEREEQQRMIRLRKRVMTEGRNG